MLQGTGGSESRDILQGYNSMIFDKRSQLGNKTSKKARFVTGLRKNKVSKEDKPVTKAVKKQDLLPV